MFIWEQWNVTFVPICSCCHTQKSISTAFNKSAAISDFTNSPNIIDQDSSTTLPSLQPVHVIPGKQTAALFQNHSHSVVATLKQSSQFNWNQLNKSNSLKIKCKIQERLFLALIDTGAEIHALDKALADSMKIGIKYKFYQ